MTQQDRVFGAGKRDAERTPSNALKLKPSDQTTYPGGRALPDQHKEDGRRRQESGHTGGERRPEPREKADARRNRGGPGQQGDDDAPEDKWRNRGSEKR